MNIEGFKKSRKEFLSTPEGKKQTAKKKAYATREMAKKVPSLHSGLKKKK